MNAPGTLNTMKTGGEGGETLPFAQLMARMARLMVGQPDYDAYVAHRQANHPGQPVLSRDAFFRDREEARYKGGVGKCC